MDLKFDDGAINLLIRAKALAVNYNHEYITPEHVLFAFCSDSSFVDVFERLGGNTIMLCTDIRSYLCDIDTTSDRRPQESNAFKRTLLLSNDQAKIKHQEGSDKVCLLIGVLTNDECDVQPMINSQGINIEDIIHEYENAENKKNGVKGKPSWLEFVTDLRKEVKKDKKPFIGREDIIDRTIQVLCRAEKNNVLHIGEPGVGKTAITLGLAEMINQRKVPYKLKDYNIYSLDIGKLIAGTKYRGEFEKRIKMILDGLKEKKKCILYIDEIHNIVGAGATEESSIDAANLFKESLTDGKIRFIGATTYDEYRKYFSKDKALERRFQPIDVPEPTPADALRIIEGIKGYYEKFHNVKFTQKALKRTIELSIKYIHDRYLPDKAIDIIDEAGAYVSSKTTGNVSAPTIIDEALIEKVVSKICNIPEITIDETSKLKSLEKNMKEDVFGQEEAIKNVCNAIKLAKTGLTSQNKPIASLLFVGPTGVGKTEVAKTLARNLDIDLVRFDMSEYSDEMSVSKLIGSSAGYVGYEDGGLLVNAIRKKPSCVLLLDEIEKAHPKVFNTLLQVMDYATLKDNQGRKADFKNVVIIMTSNAGAADVIKKNIGFGKESVVYDKDSIKNAITKTFSPEFRNRLSKIIQFNPIDNKMGQLIVEKELKKLSNIFAVKGIKLSFTEALKKYVLQKGISEEYGAREIIRVIDNELKPLFVDKLLDGKLKSRSSCVLDYSGKPVIRSRARTRTKVKKPVLA